MSPYVRFRICAVFWAVSAITVPAHSEPAPSAQDDAREQSAPLRPGEYPNYLFKPPFPAPPAEESQEFREKYLFGDWLGARSELAKLGIKPTLLFILDPFGNVTGGRQRGFTQYNLSVLDVTLETSKLFGLAVSRRLREQLGHRPLHNVCREQFPDPARGRGGPRKFAPDVPFVYTVALRRDP